MKNGCKVIINKIETINTKQYRQNTVPRIMSNNLRNKLKKNSLIYEITKNIRLFKKWKRIKELTDIIRKNNIDIIHCNNGISFAIEGIIASKLTGKVCVVHQRNFESELPYFARYFAQTVKKFIAISNAIQRNLIDEGDISNSKIEVIHNWINSKRIIAQKKETNNGFNILWIGRLIPWKGAHLLIPIAELLLQHLDDFNIDIFGSYYDNKENYFLKMKNYINESGLSTKIHLKGYQDYKNIFKKKQYDIFIHTSLEPEPFGRVVVEAMTNGIPVIATNMGGIHDIVQDGVNGFLYNPSDTSELVNKILSIKDDPKIRKKFIKNGYTTVDKYFSEKDKINKIVHIYNMI
jgi:glycosyltransferase involved in cell wall biosynthesis